MDKWSRALAAIAALAWAWAGAGCGGGTSVDANPAADSAPGTVKLGLLVTRTGTAANQGQFVEYAARLAVQEINAAGGVNGQPLELVVRDDKLDADTGVLSARELLAMDLPAIFGPFSSRVAVPVAQQATIAAGMPFVVSGSSPQITTLADHGTVWRTVASDVLQGAAVADHMLAQGHTRVAILHVDDVFGQGASEAVRARLASRGLPPLAKVQYPASKTVGFDAELTALLANGVPDAVFIVGFALDGASIARGLRARLGERMPRLYGAGNFGAAFLDNAGEAGIGMQAVSPTAPRDSPDYVAYRAAFARSVGLEPEGTSFTGYDAVYLIALAMAQGRANTRAAVLANIGSISRAEGADAVQVHPGQFAQALAALKAGRDIDYQGVGSVIDFDANGDPTAGAYLILEAFKAADGSVGFVERKVISFP